MRIFDTLSATARPFEPLGTPVKIYFCGLTPKNYPHLGHGKLFVTADVMRRYLRYRGYEVVYVQNFTDVDDKTIAKAAEEGTTFAEVAKKYTDAYFEDMDRLNVLRADYYPSATAAIPGIIDMVEGLIEKGYAYVAGGDVYYRVSSFPAYGRLSKRTADDNQAGAGLRTRKPSGTVAADTTADAPVLDASEEYLLSLAADLAEEPIAEAGKEDPRDFALWKAAKPGEPNWDSPWGPGRPGWHIECSTMVYEAFGDSIDIHGGGQDLIFPHHENEIAQSEAFTGVSPFANYWVHIAPLNITTPEGGAQKMAHSLGNFTTIRSLFNRYEPGVVRYYLVSQHYRTPVNFDLSVLDAAKESWERLRAAYSNAALLRNWAPYRDVVPAEPVDIELTRAGRRLRDAIPSALDSFRAGMDDDFGTPRATAAIQDLAREFNRFKDSLSSPQAITPTAKWLVETAFGVLNEMMDVLGLPAPDISTGVDEATAREVEALLAQRNRLREERDFAGADEVRNQLEAMNIVVEDHPQGTIWRKRR